MSAPTTSNAPSASARTRCGPLEAIHEGFARNFGASLSGFLRTIVEVRVATIEQLTYSEFIHSLPNPTCFNLLNAEPLEGQLCLEISPLIIYPIIDRLLGGSNADLFIPQRPLTAIEWRLVKQITDRAVTNLTEVWSNLVDVKFELAETESNPHLVQIVAPNEVVVVIGFELKMGTRAGTMTLCLPFNVIEPVMGKLATQSWLAYQRKAASDKQPRADRHAPQGRRSRAAGVPAARPPSPSTICCTCSRATSSRRPSRPARADPAGRGPEQVRRPALPAQRRPRDPHRSPCQARRNGLLKPLTSPTPPRPSLWSSARETGIL